MQPTSRLLFVTKLVEYQLLHLGAPKVVAIAHARTHNSDSRVLEMNTSQSFELVRFEMAAHFNNIGLVQQLTKKTRRPGLEGLKQLISQKARELATHWGTCFKEPSRNTS